MKREFKDIFFRLKSFVGGQFRAFCFWVQYGHFIRQKNFKCYFESTKRPKLHLGGGNRKVDGWLTTDILGKVPVNVAKPLPFEDDQFDIIYSSHVVEHIYYEEFCDFLKEGFRVLKPGGRHIIATPSAKKIADYWYCNPVEDNDMKKVLHERYSKHYCDGSFSGCHHLNLVMRQWGHRFVYDAKLLEMLGQRYGYINIESIDNFDIPDESLKSYLVASKPKRWNLFTVTVSMEKPS